MSYLDRLDDQILRLRILEPGWLDGEGAAIREDAIAWAVEVREACANGSIKHPVYIYPTPFGGVQVEFDMIPFAVSAMYLGDGLIECDATCVRQPAVKDHSATIRSTAELCLWFHSISEQAARWRAERIK